MCASPPLPWTGTPTPPDVIVPLMVADGVASTCAPGSNSRFQAQRGKVHSGDPAPRQLKSHWVSPALPRVPSPSITTSSVANSASPVWRGSVLPKREIAGGPAAGKVASQPLAYGRPDVGLT